ncbi:unnamed protein product [Orchesella dallaii]|uniref:Uncharacterized protein n=1 Tax=Orchesella dallaii TaxID=48710 RepID=A0ABP1PUF9_9HEXA
MLSINSIESILIIVETPSKSRKPFEDPSIRVLTPVDLMDPYYSATPPNTPASVDSIAEPVVEIFKGASSLTQQQLPTVHNLVPASAPVFNSYRSMLQGWKNSVPKLYKYPASEIEVVVYRKNGEIEKIISGEGPDPEKKSSLKEDKTVESEEECYKNVSHLLKNISKPIVMTPEDALGASVSLLPEDCNYDENIMPSGSPASLPDFPLQFDQRMISPSAKKVISIIPVSSVRTQNSEGSKPITVLSGKRQKFSKVSAFKKPNTNQSGSNENYCKENCHFMFGYGLAPLVKKGSDSFVDNVINVENLLTDNVVRKASEIGQAEIGQLSYATGRVQNRFAQTDIQSSFSINISGRMNPCVPVERENENVQSVVMIPVTKSMDVQTEPEPQKLLMEVGCQNVPNVSYQEIQTDPEPQKTVLEFGCQKVPITSYQEIQTEPEPKKSVMEFGCQKSPSVSYQMNQTEPEPPKLVQDFGGQIGTFVSHQDSQTETEALKNAQCQTLYSQRSGETQTFVEVSNIGCQIASTIMSQSNQTELHILNPVVHEEVQTVVEVSQIESEGKCTTEAGIQCAPSVVSKEIQLSGSCCYFTEKRIRQMYENEMKTMVEMARQKLNKDASSSKGEDSVENNVVPENITGEVVDRLLDRFNHNSMVAEQSREELRVQVEGLTQRLARFNSLDTTQTTDYFEDDFVENNVP